MKKELLKLALLALALGGLTYSSTAWAGKPGGGSGGGGTKCPREDVWCPDVMDPVICSNGMVYNNGCEAYKACATGCVPYGDI